MIFDVKKEDENKSGIYCIKSLFDNRSYIGSTKNFKKRYNEHFWQLKNKKHSSIKLQRFYDKYAAASLSFEIIEFCDIDDLSKREQHWLDNIQSYKNGFNCNPISGGLVGLMRTMEWNKKISDSNKGKTLTKEHKKN